jgi:hypothetical protein
MTNVEFYDMHGNRVTREEWLALLSDVELRRIGYTRVPQEDGEVVVVSTVWLGINASHDDRPRIFETLVFGGIHDGFMSRYATRLEAEKGHEDVVVLVGGRRDEAWPIQKPLFSDP